MVKGFMYVVAVMDRYSHVANRIGNYREADIFKILQKLRYY